MKEIVTLFLYAAFDSLSRILSFITFLLLLLEIFELFEQGSDR